MGLHWKQHLPQPKVQPRVGERWKWPWSPDLILIGNFVQLMGKNGTTKWLYFLCAAAATALLSTCCATTKLLSKFTVYRNSFSKTAVNSIVLWVLCIYSFVVLAPSNRNTMTNQFDLPYFQHVEHVKGSPRNYHSIFKLKSGALRNSTV